MRRRDALSGSASAAILAVLAACGVRPAPRGGGDTRGPTDASADSSSPAPDSGAPGCAATPGRAADGWVEVPLSDHPALREPGGSVTLSLPDSLLYVVVACTAPGCWTALWSTCTHGACGILWDAAAGEAWCPCHGSRFAVDGAVLQGPAVRPLSAFAVGRRGDSLWIHRPL